MKTLIYSAPVVKGLNWDVKTIPGECSIIVCDAGISSHTRLAYPEVVDRGLAESVLKPSIGVGTFKKDFDPSLTSGMSAALLLGHCLQRRPCIKQRVSGGENSTGSITDSSHHISADTRRYMRQGWINIKYWEVWGIWKKLGKKWRMTRLYKWEL